MFTGPTDCNRYWPVLTQHLVAQAAMLNNKRGGGLTPKNAQVFLVPVASPFLSKAWPNIEFSPTLHNKTCLTCPSKLFFSLHLSVLSYPRGHFLLLYSIFLLNTSFLFLCRMRIYEYGVGLARFLYFTLIIPIKKNSCTLHCADSLCLFPVS